MDVGVFGELLNIGSKLTNPYIEEWKREGKKVLGFICSYAPEEVLQAAGVLPYRIKALESTETTKADVYLYKYHCTFCRHFLNLVISGAYDFLDGVVFMNPCDTIRRVYEIWEKIRRPAFMGFVTVPHVINDHGFKFYLEELQYLKRELEVFLRRQILDKDLENAVHTYNEMRELLEKLYELRSEEKPKIRGSEAHKIVVAGSSMPKEKYIELLKQAISEIEKRPGISEYRARVMVAGSIGDRPDLIEVIEELGGVVVTDALCTGTRWFMDKVKEIGDPLENIARRYYEHNPCPRMIGEYERKRKIIIDLAKKADVDGVVFQRLSFCDYHAVDSVLLARDLEEEGIPAIVLEREYLLTDIGRFKTRIQAFLEIIER